MRLLSDSMSVPEVNVAVGNEIKAESILAKVKVNKPAENSENRNLQLARHVEEEKLKLIDYLAKFPLTAEWLIDKYQQDFDKQTEEEGALTEEWVENLKSIKKHHKAAKQALTNSDTPYQENKAYLKLVAVLKEFPYAFEDLNKLCDMLVLAFKSRGLCLNASRLTDKKQADIVTKRLNRPNSKSNPGLTQAFWNMDNQTKDKQSLFLPPEDMSIIMGDLLLAEHRWLMYRQELASANSKLVLFIANQYKGIFLDFDDLVQEGHTGLLKAVDRFKYRLGFQFSTYAGYWIRQAISRALSRSERVVRIPCGQVASINKVFRAKDELTLKTGKEPSVLELSKHTGIPEDDINVILTIAQSSIPLESFDDDEDEQTLSPIDFLEQNVFKHSFNQIADTQLQELVESAVKTLNAREAKIICSHFGIGTDQQQTLQEIGADLHLTRERVRQIQVVALKKIRMRYGEQLAGYL